MSSLRVLSLLMAGTLALGVGQAQMPVPAVSQPEAQRLEVSAPFRTLVNTSTDLRFTLSNVGEAPAQLTLLLDADPSVMLGSSSLNVTLQPHEVRVLSVTATPSQVGTFQVRGRVVTQGTLAEGLAEENVRAQTSSTLEVLPGLRAARESDLSLPFRVSQEALSVVVAQRLPQGTVYRPGSSTLAAEPLTDPKVGQNSMLYWTVSLPPADPTLPKGAQRPFVLSYKVSHSGDLPALAAPALQARFPGDTDVALVGQIDSQDLAQASQSATASVNPGVIKLPLDGAVFRDRSRISVMLEGSDTADLSATLNGQPLPEDALGKTVTDPKNHSVHLEYFGLPLQEGKNVLAVGGEQVTVFLAGAPVRLEAEPKQMVADGFTPLEIRLSAVDKNGITGRDGFITVDSNLEVLDPDANPTESNYQVKLVNGVGILHLRPQAVPTRLNLKLAIGELRRDVSFDVRPNATQVGIGTLSATVGLQPFSVGITGRGYYEGPLAGGKLYVAGAAEYQGRSAAGGWQTPTSGGRLPVNETTVDGYTVYGDSSSASVPLQGIDPLALRYEHPRFQVSYGQVALPITTLAAGGGYTALTAETKGDVQFSGFVAAVPSSTVQRTLTPDGTRLLKIGEAVEYGSEHLELVLTDRMTGVELSRKPLTWLVDYTLDADSGVLEFVRPLTSTDEQLNPQSLELTYRTPDPLGHRYVIGGAQVKTTQGPFSASAAIVSLRQDGDQNTVTFGTRLSYTQGTNSAEVYLAYAHGMQATLSAQTQTQALSVSARARTQSEGYDGVGKGSVGTDVAVDASYKVTPQFSVQASGLYGRAASGSSALLSASANYTFSSFTLGAGLRQQLLSNPATFVTAKAAYNGPKLGAEVSHAQVLVGQGDPQTQFSVRYALTPQLSLKLTDLLTWGKSNQAALGVENKFGNTTLSANYELPSSGGQGNRARFGANTQVPITDRLSANVQAAYSADLALGNHTTEGGVDLSYRGDQFTASAGVSANLPSDGDAKLVYKGGLSSSIGRVWTLAADATSERSAVSGNRLTVSAALRDGLLEGLAYVRYADGSLKGNSTGDGEVTSQIGLTYRKPQFQVRGALNTLDTLGVDYGLLIQPQLGGTLYLTDWLGMGVYGRALYQPGLQSVQWGLGLEGTVRVFDGTWATVGYNPTGFNGIGSDTHQGFYLRLDLLLQENNR
ncbi:hypothetical protein GCM10022631_04940 [Deinococcus rubellus]|uniref:Uncharacterized protein n=1 Tax=Deinococcus rubellus TaxID=1889240 RepID=A0ABY5YH91_9DEIO|nr:hypothetical protein [Deinococcus rubellus]UWX64153.1 hypothetical protein N0D28_00280 [Deinococcus rubellus]